MMDNLKKFHDAALDSLVFHWETRVLELVLRPVGVGSSVVFRLKAVSKFTVSSEAPWGNSSSVNFIRCEAYGASKRASIEIQSGDVIDVICDELEFVPSSETTVW